MIKESIRYHEFVHVEQEIRTLFVFSFYFDAFDVYVAKRPKRSEVEAYTRQKKLINDYINRKELKIKEKNKLIDFREDNINYFLLNPKEM